MHRTILIVEDDTDLREALTQALRDEGYTVESANHGQEALEQLRSASHLPCVILLDLTMPVMNGWQFRAAQRTDPLLAAVPVVVLSAGSNLQEQVSLLGVDQYIRKPIPLPRLLEVVGQYCAAPPAPLPS